MIEQNIQAIILAAGRSKRFKTPTSKQLASVCGTPMLLHPLRLLEKAHIPTTVVLGHQAEKIERVIRDDGFRDVTCVVQKEQKGTANALAASASTWAHDNILVLNGDMPLVTHQVITDFIDHHIRTQATLSFCAMHATNPFGYGRVIKSDGSYRIVEENECSPAQRTQTLVNAGIYVIKRSFLEKALNTIDNANASGEFYLTDLVARAKLEREAVSLFLTDFDTVRGVNTLTDLWEVEHIMRARLIQHWMDHGVRFMMPHTVHIDSDVTIGTGTTIGIGVHLVRGTSIGNMCTIEPFVVLSNAHLDDEVTIRSHSALHDSRVKTGSSVGPFARLRENVMLDENAVVGNFVELKKTRFGAGSKAKHLSYLGDTTVGSNVNIGAGTITCNHDGARKHATYIADDAYVGSNTTLVAPLDLGRGSFTAAGSVITKPVPEDDLALARSRQVNKQGYGKKIREKKLAAQRRECIVPASETTPLDTA